jgi:metal-responsive CopG/Arc/MetJ family transcriptional regulator
MRVKHDAGPWQAAGIILRASRKLRGMRVRISVTLDAEILRAIDQTTSRYRGRSRVLEDAAQEFLARRARTADAAKDLKIINEAAEALNREAEDVLSYQAE